MQRLDGLGLMGVSAPAVPTPRRGTGTLSLADAVAIAGGTRTPVRARPAVASGGARPTRGADDGLTVITEVQARAHERGTRPLRDGTYSVRDASGRHLYRLDVGERVCRLAAFVIRARRTQDVSTFEDRPTGRVKQKQIRPC